MWLAIYASEPGPPARAAAERLAAAGVPCRVEPARVALPAAWGAAPGELDVLVEHRDLARATLALALALAGQGPAPVAGAAAPGGTTVLRLARSGPGWSDALGHGPAGELRVVRTVALRGEAAASDDVAWELARATHARAARLRAVTELVPAAVDAGVLAAEGGPSLQLVLAPRPLPSATLAAEASRGPAPLHRVLLAWRVLRDACFAAAGLGLALGPLRPDGLLVHEDGALLDADSGLDAALRAAGGTAPPPGPLAAPWRSAREPDLGADLYEAAAAARALLVGRAAGGVRPGPGEAGAAPAGLAPVEAFFAAVMDEGKRGAPSSSGAPSSAALLDERLDAALRPLGRCGRCGEELASRGRCPRCVARSGAT